MSQEINRLNIRVYGLLINQHNEILLVHEKIGDFHFTKFPGGGLEIGEGTRDCLVREFKEETGMDIKVGMHYYTTDFFQQSAFKKTDQLISIYYRVHPISDVSLIPLEEFDIDNNGRIEQLRFFWKPMHELDENAVTFPIDKHVCSMLKNS
jgi:8-oxo-dGTP pyrophosphatase MutT (NUDIX family)